MKNPLLLVLVALSFTLLSCRRVPETNSQMRNAEAEVALGMADREKGEYPNSLQHFQKAIALAPKMTKAHFAGAKVSDDMCLPNAEPGPYRRICGLGIQEYKKVVELDPSHREAMENLAYLLSQFGRWEESESCYQKALSLHADDATALCAVAATDIYRIRHDLEEAKARLKWETLLMRSPACNEVRDRNQARSDESIALLTRALRVSNNSELEGKLVSVHYLRAELQCGDYRAYLANLKTARAESWKRNVHENDLQKCPWRGSLGCPIPSNGPDG